MRKWMKRTMLGVALLMALAALFLTGGFVLLRGTPDFYRQSALNSEQRAEAAARAESKLSQMQNLASDAQGAEIQRRLGTTTTPATAPGARTFSFTDEELNALFNKWAELHNWKDLLQRTIDDPMIVLRNGQIIFAGKVTLDAVPGVAKNTIVSIYFEPKLTADGQFDLKLVSMMGGKLPLPKDTLVSPMREKLSKYIAGALPGWQQRAEIAADGATNADAMKSALGKLLMKMFADQPGEPVLFLPLLSRGSTTVPVRLTDVTIANNTLSLTVIPLDAPQRSALLERIKAPVALQPTATVRD